MVEVRALRDYNLNDFDIDKGNNFVLDRFSVVGKGVVNKECYSWLSNSKDKELLCFDSDIIFRFFFLGDRREWISFPPIYGKFI